MTRARTSSAVLFGVLLVACSEEDAHAPAARDAGAERSFGDGSASDASDLPDFSQIRCEPTLASLQRDVFGVACAFDSCHGNNSAAWDLFLLAPDVEGRLIDGPAYVCAGWVLVAPGSPERSLLWRKLADPVPRCGEAMPLGLGRLPEPALQCVRQWILSLDAADSGGGG